MPAIETSAFRIGDDIAVERPTELGISANTVVRMERVGDHRELRVADDNEPPKPIAAVSTSSKARRDRSISRLQGQP